MIRIRCLLCREPFRWDTNDGWPSHCPVCNGYIGSDGNDEVATPFISKAQNKGPDRVYRDMEAKSEFRAQQAAELMGASAAEVSHLKMTDMKDNLRAGDMAFSNNLNAQQQQMSNQMTLNPSLGIQASAGTNVGPEPRAGTRYIQEVLKPNHFKKSGAPVTNHPSIEFWKPAGR